MSHYEQLQARLTDLHNLNMAFWLLQWDQNTMMPAGGEPARAKQMSTLRRIRHEMLTDDTTATLINKAAQEVDNAPFASAEASLVRVAQRDYESASKLPAAFVAQLTETIAASHGIWSKARANDDYALFKPQLQKIMDLKMQEAEYIGYDDTPYDAMLQRWEPGLNTAEVERIFAAHRDALVELVAAIRENQHNVDDSVLHQTYDEAAQREFALIIAEAFGFDFKRGRLDPSVHPFCLQMSRDDVRLTTRYTPNFFNPAFFGMLHETGHGLHAQGFGADIDGTFLSDMELNSAAVDESQSRTWENMVGRSQGFWQWAFPKLQQTFPQQLGDITAEQFYRAVNKVNPNNYIRVEADEATYNLHIMLRFEIERDWIAGDLSIDDLPQAWNDKFEAFFGVRPPNNRLGLLQDIHWSMGGIGAFHGYALGNLLAAQYYAKALEAHPSIPDEISQGQFGTLLTWLTENIYTHGRKFTADEITQQVTGESINPAHYVRYLQQKMTNVYNL